MVNSAAFCILLVLSIAPTGGQDLLFFSEDHYKSLGEPQLKASLANPFLSPGRATLFVDLANGGELEELIAVDGSGSREDMLQEMKEEMRGPDALNISAELLPSGPVLSAGGRRHIDSLPAGQKARMAFDVSLDMDARGWYDLPLLLEYERQVDASVTDGEVFPMRQAERRNLTLRAYANGGDQPLKISAIRSDLAAGGEGEILAAVAGREGQTLHNCSARLIDAGPFHADGRPAALGDIHPGELAVARFGVEVDESALAGDYQLGCMVCCREKCITLPLPITLTSDRWPGQAGLTAFGPSLTMLFALALLGMSAFILLRRRGSLPSSRKRRWR